MPRIVDRDKKRSEIAQKAIEVLAKRGFQATTIQEIADAAGLGKGTVYHYFKTKEEILSAVSEEIFHEMERSFGAALLRIDKPMEKLSALIEEALHVTEDVEHLFIVYTELWLMNIRGDKYNDYMSVIKNLHNDLKNLTAGMIDEGKKQGLWDKDTDSDALAAYLVASFDGVVVHYMMDKGNFDIKRVTKEFIRFVLRQGTPKK
ncbi:MAG: TetR/AcrR family transcriptional regulator [Desulfobacterales bacterium]|nr:TetR/AcrR family transcriptional regulator [Desulfobacterales bacterium]